MTLALQATITQQLITLGDMQQSPALAVNKRAPLDQPIPPILEVQPPLALEAPQPFIPKGAMLLQVQKMLRVFQRISLLTFLGAIGEDSIEFLTICREHLQSLGLVEFKRANFTTH